MPRPPLLALAAASLIAAAAPAAAGAATPPGFFGVTYDREITNAPSAFQDAQFGAMAATGVQSARVVFNWFKAQPKKDGPISFARTDAVVARAARNNVALLACVLYAPEWARVDAFSGASPPKRPSEYAAYLTALIQRYGPEGTFWAANPEIPKRPLREWQIWNEPSLKFQWDAKRWQRGYGQLLRTAHAAIKAADPGATVVLAGLPNKTWEELASLYRLGNVKGYFDVVGMHVYTGAPIYVLELARLVRKEMKRQGDGDKPAWMTEVGLPAAKGRTRSKSTLQTSDSGMGRFLRESYTMLAGRGSGEAFKVGRVYWYTWASDYRGREIFEYAGLNRFASRELDARPALGYFRNVIRRLRG